MMTTGKVFGNSDINNRPEFGGIDPRITTQQDQTQSIVDEQLRIAQKNATLLQEAIAKFLAKEITKEELAIVQESLK